MSAIRHSVATEEALYRFEIDAISVLDEPRFGRRSYVKALVVR
jgi:hypothetical protein